ncbi:septal ring lytic transglycosylase RlpA family protein [Ursidibacter maritimus]|uniref:septal ring lytic transglycosylase RlpA family protein n=1 Tax=Ursidibacter maritimus TaxID=1331689 RepID=UPI001E4605D1|nr:septal ring lytic transglycosylase RlpA family protein [Ursidibacter maritimus]
MKSPTKRAKSSVKNAKNETKKRYGVKGASLNYVKVSNKRLTYREKGKNHTTINKENSRQYGQVGTASYYAGKFHGRKTASGEIYNKNGFTAAHKTLALGSYALVTNLRNGRKVIVRINDRGPFSHSRVIDLSMGAAREIGMIHSGVAKVRIEALQVDRQGYISGKGAQALLQLAKKEGLPLKVKGEGSTLAIKAK